jgi:hypothetical protein
MKKRLHLGLLGLLFSGLVLSDTAQGAPLYGIDIEDEDFDTQISPEQAIRNFNQCILSEESRQNIVRSFYGYDERNHSSRNCHFLADRLFFENLQDENGLINGRQIDVDNLTIDDVIHGLKADSYGRTGKKIGYFLLPQDHAETPETFFQGIFDALNPASIQSRSVESGTTFTFRLFAPNDFPAIIFHKESFQFKRARSVRFYFDANDIFQSCYPASPGNEIDRDEALAIMQYAYPSLRGDNAPQANEEADNHPGFNIDPHFSDISPSIRNSNSQYESWEDFNE